jgi:ABC-type branched-subunit amino acid transport system substrate-binding protein
MALPMAAGCNGGAPAATEIRIGVMGGQTGPAASSVVALLEELENVFNYVNDVEGGIDGANLSWRIVDNKGTPEGAVTAYKELKGGFNPLFYIAVEGYYYLGVKDELAEDQTAMFTLSAIDPRGYLPPSVLFSVSLPISDGFAGFAKWVLENHEGAGKPKIGVLYWEDLPTGSMWQMAQPWVMKQGVELEPIGYSISTMDLKPQLMRLRDAEVDYIWMLGLTQNAALAIRDFRSLGMAGEIPFCFNEFIEPDVLLDLVGEAAEGFYSYRAESPDADGTEAAELYTEILNWATDEEKRSDQRITITFKAVITAAIKQAVADVGWDNLDSEAFYNALNNLSNVDTWGNTKDFSFSPDKRVGVSAIKMGRYTKTERVTVGDWIDLPRIFEGKAE